MSMTPGLKQHITERIDATLKVYHDRHDLGSETQIRDLLCDLMHHAKANGIDFDHELSMATDFFGDEQEGPE